MDVRNEPSTPDDSHLDAAIDPSSEERAASDGSAHPTRGARVSEDKRQAALDAMPAGNATTADMVDTDDVDSAAHDD